MNLIIILTLSIGSLFFFGNDIYDAKKYCYNIYEAINIHIYSYTYLSPKYKI